MNDKGKEIQMTVQGKSEAIKEYLESTGQPYKTIRLADGLDSIQTKAKEKLQEKLSGITNTYTYDWKAFLKWDNDTDDTVGYNILDSLLLSVSAVNEVQENISLAILAAHGSDYKSAGLNLDGIEAAVEEQLRKLDKH